jgi:hypothetical protein
VKQEKSKWITRRIKASNLSEESYALNKKNDRESVTSFQTLSVTQCSKHSSDPIELDCD